MKSNTKIKIKYLRLMAIYGIIMLCIIIFLTFTNNKKTTSEYIPQDSESIQTQIEYVYVKPDISTAESESESTEEVYTVKEYMGKIGIFSSDGVLIEVLDVYVKTLPEADKRLLGEGFNVTGKKQLNSIIEDYSE